MKNLTRYLLFRTYLSLCGLLFIVQTSISASPSERTDPFEDVHGECWQSTLYRYSFKEDGTIGRLNRKTGKTSNELRISLHGMLSLGVYSVKPIDNDLLILYQAASGGHGLGAICRYQQVPWSKKWCLTFPAFNLKASLSADKSIYIAGIGFIGRVDQKRGQFIWKHENLYSIDKPFSIQIPYFPFETDRFVTIEGLGWDQKPTGILRLNRLTGEVLEYKSFDRNIHTPHPRTDAEKVRGQGACP